jgi:enamine deaminase RidA (YjgF/YER057c/UK114 family)
MNLIDFINPVSLRVPTKSYSNGVLLHLGKVDVMFVTGQLSQDASGTILHPNDAEAQARHIFSRIATILAEGAMSLDNILKVQIFVTSINDAPLVSRVRDEVLKVSRPASTLLEVGAMIKPECCVEIEVIAGRATE